MPCLTDFVAPERELWVRAPEYNDEPFQGRHMLRADGNLPSAEAGSAMWRARLTQRFRAGLQR